MGLLDGLEKLINEHGSAAILKERIALANDKYVALEKKLSDSEFRIYQLESENGSLKLDLSKAQEKIRNLEDKLIERHGNRLEELREKILVLVSQTEDISDAQVAQSVSIPRQLATLHLQDLKTANFVSSIEQVDDDARLVNVWRITQEARRYLLSHGLL